MLRPRRRSLPTGSSAEFPGDLLAWTRSLYHESVKKCSEVQVKTPEIRPVLADRSAPLQKKSRERRHYKVRFWND